MYEYMVNGNLARHLYATNPDPVPWKRRLQICVGVVRGLYCLHTGLKHTIIHGDVKPSNILLNEKWEAKLGDFGLSKMGPPSLSKALIRIETYRIVGTYGYMAPEYAMNMELTDKSDVYSFGVLLLEVFCGREPIAGEEPMDLVRWARKCKRERNVNEIIDPYLMGKIAPECFMVYVDIATSCVRNRPERRPTMGEVQVCLEHALELQESADDAAAATGDCNYVLMNIPAMLLRETLLQLIRCGKQLQRAPHLLKSCPWKLPCQTVKYDLPQTIHKYVFFSFWIGFVFILPFITDGVYGLCTC